MISEMEIPNAIFRFNHEHYLDVRRNRELKNKIVINKEWNHYYHEGNQIIEHELRYKIIRRKSSGELYIVTRVLKQFFAGWYTVVQYDTIGNSSGIVQLDNGSSIALPQRADFYNEFEVTDITPSEFFASVEGMLNAFGEPVGEWFEHAKELNVKVIEHFKK